MTRAPSCAGSRRWSATTSRTSCVITTPRRSRATLRAYVAARTEYDYREHTRQGADHFAYVPDEIVDRFTVLGPVEACRARLSELEALGVTEFNLYTTMPEPEP